MKVIAIGDLHGKDCWKDIDPSKHDRIIFLGDYVDNPSIAEEEIISNLEEIIELKNLLPDKVILLLGNHDIQYLDFPNYKCSGFNWLIQSELTKIFQLNRDKFQVAYQCDNWLFSHAGVTNTFWQATFNNTEDKNIETIATKLNTLQGTSGKGKLHIAGEGRGGFYPYSGITWADMRETAADYLTGYHQVVGHTRVLDFVSFSKANSRGINSSITYIDVLDSMTKFFETEILS